MDCNDVGESFTPWSLNCSNVSFQLRQNVCDDVPSQLPPYPYFGEQLRSYRLAYAQVHGYISLTVCIFGISANILNIIVLTRKNMLSPTNAILTGLAVADMLVMLAYVPHAIHNYVKNQDDEDKYTYGWAVYILVHISFTIMCHTISTWLTVTVAIWRFMAVCYPAVSIRWRGLLQARKAIVLTYASCLIICIPLYLSFHICKGRGEKHSLIYTVQFNELARRHDMLLQKVSFWMFSVVSKLVPCIALTALSFGLISVLYEANVRRKRLKIVNDNSHDRTTKMILAVLMLFLATEFPSGMLALLSGVLGEKFYVHVYSNFGETMDILALVNSAVNFIIYCSMSRQFRDTFAYLFIPNIKKKWMAIPTVETTQTLATACV